jgi:hypothetical protein
VCVHIKGKYKLIIPKLEYLWKHASHCKALEAMVKLKKNNIISMKSYILPQLGLKTMLQHVIHGVN